MIHNPPLLWRIHPYYLLICNLLKRPRYGAGTLGEDDLPPDMDMYGEIGRARFRTADGSRFRTASLSTLSGLRPDTPREDWKGPEGKQKPKGRGRFFNLFKFKVKGWHISNKNKKTVRTRLLKGIMRKSIFNSVYIYFFLCVKDRNVFS